MGADNNSQLQWNRTGTLPENSSAAKSFIFWNIWTKLHFYWKGQKRFKHMNRESLRLDKYCYSLYFQNEKMCLQWSENKTIPTRKIHIITILMLCINALSRLDMVQLSHRSIICVKICSFIIILSTQDKIMGVYFCSWVLYFLCA